MHQIQTTKIVKINIEMKDKIILSRKAYVKEEKKIKEISLKLKSETLSYDL
jgi:hypothetical protein